MYEKIVCIDAGTTKRIIRDAAHDAVCAARDAILAEAKHGEHCASDSLRRGLDKLAALHAKHSHALRLIADRMGRDEEMSAAFVTLVNLAVYDAMDPETKAKNIARAAADGR